MMSGSGVSSRSRARAGMKGRKLARIGFVGCGPTMSWNSLGGLGELANAVTYAVRFAAILRIHL